MDHSSQMRVATILTSFGWKKVAMRYFAGKRQQCGERVPTLLTNFKMKSQPLNLNEETFEIAKKSFGIARTSIFYYFGSS